MRKHLLSLFALGSMLFASSCSQEEVISQSTGNEVKVTFTTELRNDVKSRAVGDNTTCIDELIFAVYDENEVLLPSLTQKVSDKKITLSEVNENGTRTATINVVLTKGQTYSFAFWAQNSAYEAYSFDPVTKKVSINYGQTANNVNADAFFANFKHTVTGSFEHDIKLKRPFAQVNFLNTNYDFTLAERAGFIPDQSSIVVKNAATSLDVLTGEVEGDTEATFTLANLISANETTTIKDDSGNEVTFGGSTSATNFRYLATAYFLPTKKTEAVEIEASMSVIQSTNDTKAPVELTVPKVNAQRNYRTNIYGNLLTNNGQFNVTVDPGFDGDHSEEEENPVTKVVSTFEEAQELLKDGITNVTIENAPTADVNLTLPNTTNDVTINFAFDANENNNTITIGYNNATTDVPANITIGGGNGSLVINADASTVNLEGGVYETVTATTAENTLIVPASVQIKKLILEKGNAKIYYGNVKEIVNEGNVDITWLVDSKEQLAKIASDVNKSKTFVGETIELISDIDLNNENWTTIGTVENPYMGSFDGQNHIIKNLQIVETEAKEGKAYIGFFGYAKDVTIKNVTFENVYLNIPCLDIDHSQGHIGAVAGSLEGTSTIENVTVKGNIKVEATPSANGASRVAVVAGGNSYGNVTMKNVHVIANEGSYLKANNNTGALAGQLQGKMVFENCSSNINVTANKFFAGGLVGIAATDSYIKNCHTTGDVAVVAGREGRHNDEYRVGGIAGGWADGKTNVFTLEGCSYTGQVSGKNSDGTVAYPLDYAGYVGRGYTLANCAGSKVIIDDNSYVQAYDDIYGIYIVNGYIKVGIADELIKALEAKYSVEFTEDITINPASMSNAYGKTGINVKYGQTINGNGHTLNINGAGGTWDSGICTSGGIIKNIWVKGSFRGIFVKGGDHIEKVVLDNVRVEGTTYTISIDQASRQGLEATNSIFRGWTSYAATIGNVKFTGCTFGAGSGYNFSRPYAPTEYVNCNFEEGHVMDPRAAVTFENCTLNGVALTAENLATLVTSNIANATVK